MPRLELNGLRSDMGTAPRSGALRFLAAAALILFAGSVAFAHSESSSGGFVGGLAHPFFGLDHLLAMLAIGLWGAFLGPPAIWLLPIVFPPVMALGGVIGIMGVPLPGVEIAIALSVVVLGMLIASAARPRLWVAAMLVGAFAVFHGHAHGAELPPGTDPVTYSAGFVAATGLLHLAGILCGLLAQWPAGRAAVRTAGGLIALTGAGLLSGLG